MANWLQVSNLKGIYTSPSILIPLQADGCLSKVTWQATSNTDSNIVVQTRISQNNRDWTEWELCTNRGSIPQINESTGLYNHYIMFRVLMNATNYSSQPTFTSISFDFEPIILFDNKGDMNCSPEIWITKRGNGDFSIINLSHNNDEFKLTALIDGETVYVDNERQDIETSLAVAYRYKDFNDNYLSFPIGKNILRVIGDADIQFRYQFKLLQ
ncbi:phage tail domain-containing protein [Paenibacillus illinoisensis]|uniref:Phage tail-like C-terminal domain-containing protein n=1 Tax=Paenibacillus illinoisensis TaxID=59845 RepID=A0A2W0C8P5_9BACL|nr:phage tail domain-containing protein [Paenibacillus illinoisensis]PYY28384.1 Uncharacterized protein PIL02S_03540 [Paenibacillus illinoisensis]